MRSDLTSGPREGGYVDSRSRECSNGSPRCERAVAPDPNPLGLCDGHLEEYNARCGIAGPVVCPACGGGLLVLIGGRYAVVPGAMCFGCGMANGGTVASPGHRAGARAKMRARLIVLFDAGDRGAEWAALLARCPADIRAAFERRLAVTPLAPADG